MQQLLKLKLEEEDITARTWSTGGNSAFKSPQSWQGMSPTLTGLSSSNRDSGYGTDFSPASITSATRKFTFEGEDSDLSDVFEGAMDLTEDDNEDVFFDNVNTCTYNVIEEESEGDDTDKEVEDLFSSSDIRRPMSQPINIARPAAPIPTPEYMNGVEGMDEMDGWEQEREVQISSPFHHTQWNSRDRHFRRNRFRPIVSRSCGTQTPSPQSQVIREAREVVNSGGRFQPYGLAIGQAINKLRIRSDYEETDERPPLPDIVPFPRDRSVSLPDVQAFRRQEVGKELRRISDEFFSESKAARTQRRRTVSEQASSFPMQMNIDISATWQNIRRIMSSPIFGQRRQPEPETDEQPPNRKDGV